MQFKVVGEDIKGHPIVMHFRPTPDGWDGILCMNGSCKFTIRGREFNEAAALAFAKQVIMEEFGVSEDYKVRLVKD